MAEAARSVDAVVVGGGIAGSTLAGQLAATGHEVVVLEQQSTFKDRVRGETIAPWGVREVIRLGVEQALLAAGGAYATTFIPYDETVAPDVAEASQFPLPAIAPDVPGQLNVGHPEATEALLVRAAAAGAEVHRGVADVVISAGDAPEVTWTDAQGERHTVGCRLIVGADGRRSTVRRQLGIELEERPGTVFGAGLLVRTPDGLREANAFGSEGRACYLAFPRQDDLTRLYLMVDIDRQSEFSGADRAQRFLDEFRAESFPQSAAYTAAEVAGPCGGAPMTDSWTVGSPAVPGAVLVGDAAGWNDPLIGQGLSIAFRDVRMVTDVLTATPSSAWTTADFGEWVEERRERMRRLLIAAYAATAIRCDFTDEGRARRRRLLDSVLTEPNVTALIASPLVGPEVFPAEPFEEETVAATLHAPAPAYLPR